MLLDLHRSSRRSQPRMRHDAGELIRPCRLEGVRHQLRLVRVALRIHSSSDARLLTTTWCATLTAQCTSRAAATSAASTWTAAASAWCASAGTGTWSTLAWTTATTAATCSCCLLRHCCWVRVRRHHRWRWTATTGLATRLWLVFTVV